jgi:hypothetical protein
LKEFALAGGKIVPSNDGLAVSKQAVNEVAAYETGGTGDKNISHDLVRESVTGVIPVRQLF